MSNYPKLVSRWAIGTLALVGIAGGFGLTRPALAQQALQTLASVVTCSSTLPCAGGTNNSTGPGVQGISAKGKGVIGQAKFNSTSISNAQSGVLGQDLSTSGVYNSGVRGTSTRGTGASGTSTSGVGVVGSSVSNDGMDATTSAPSKTMRAASGIYGHDASTDGGTLNNGVAGYSSKGTGAKGQSVSGPGVVGLSASNDGVSGGSTSGYGVSGFSTDGAALEGHSINGPGAVGTSGNNDGMDATTSTPSKTNTPRSGIFGYDASTDGGTGNNGVAGYSLNGTGISGSSANGTGVFATGIPAIVARAAPSAVYVIFAEDSSGSGIFRLDEYGNVFITGTITTGGSCNAGCAPKRASVGKRLVSYTPHESVPTMEDFGEAQLANGQAYVRMDPAFVNGIDRRAGYLVFPAPEGDSRGLYVTQKTAAGFLVRESQGGRSTLAFSYRIVAKPFGSTEPRLPMVEMRPMKQHPLTPHPAAPRMAPR